MPEMFALEFDDREPAGPDLIGPFPTRSAALAHLDSLNLARSESCVRPLSAPEEADRA